jgi:hypothetical protein
VVYVWYLKGTFSFLQKEKNNIDMVAMLCMNERACGCLLVRTRVHNVAARSIYSDAMIEE